MCPSDVGTDVVGMFHSATEHTEGELTDCRRGVCCVLPVECAYSPSVAGEVSVYVYCYSAAYCDSKFVNASADFDGKLCSSDPGTVRSSDDMVGVEIEIGSVVTMLVRVVFE